MADDTLPATQAWLRKSPANMDPAAYDRVADVVLDAMTVLGGGPENMAARLMVLVKLQAMMLAALTSGGDPEALSMAQWWFDNVGAMTEREVNGFRRAVRRDRVRHVGH